ncbi:antileukoproteinase-like [Saccostrea cucullata]|uniref:antileukoproteinase-like n=1 Tax=Saccostrea cuccullata TaxID=36930 RepID=UPI002ED21F86
MNLGLCVLVATIWTYTLAYPDPKCPPNNAVKCNPRFDVPCQSSKECRGKRICCPDEGGHPVCTTSRPGSCRRVKTRHCGYRNTDTSECSRDDHCPLPARCCLTVQNGRCRRTCQSGTDLVYTRGYFG